MLTYQGGPRRLLPPVTRPHLAALLLAAATLTACGSSAAAPAAPAAQAADPAPIMAKTGCTDTTPATYGLGSFRVQSCTYPSQEQVRVRTYPTVAARDADLAAGGNADATIVIAKPPAAVLVWQPQTGFDPDPHDIATLVGGTVQP